MQGPQRTIIVNEDDNRKLGVYTEGDADAAIDGVAILGEGPANALTPIKVTSAGGVEIAKPTLLQAIINASTAADHTIVAADASNKIKIVSMRLTVAGETNLTFKRGATSISGAMDFGGTGEPKGMVDGGSVFNPILETDTNEAFVITSSAAVQVSGWVRYFKEA